MGYLTVGGKLTHVTVQRHEGTGIWWVFVKGTKFQAPDQQVVIRFAEEEERKLQEEQVAAVKFW